MEVAKNGKKTDLEWGQACDTQLSNEFEEIVL